MGGRSKLMFTNETPMHMTYAELNNIAQTITIHYSDRATQIADDPYTSPSYYLHGNIGIRFYTIDAIGIFGGTTVRIQKLENGSWFTKWTKNYNYGGPYNTQIKNDWGPGYFRVDGTSSWHVRVDFDFYPAQNNCVQGDYLAIYDNFASSGNRLVGEPLTAGILNQGRGGTFKK